MYSIGKHIVGLFAAASASLLCLTATAAREIRSPGFQAAWVELQRDGRVFYHCLVDVRSCDAKRLDLVVQFRWATSDKNILLRGSDNALMLFPETRRRPTEDAADWRWRPQPVEIPASLWEKADLKPGDHAIDAIFDLYDPDARKYAAGGWIWRATLHVGIAADGKASVAPYFPYEAPPLTRNPGVETIPSVVVQETPAAESVPAALAGYGWKQRQLLGTARLRHGADVARIAFSRDGKWIISASEDRTVCVWDGRRGTLHQWLEGQLLTAEDGTALVLTTQGKPTVVDPGRSEPLCRIAEPPQAILAAGLSADAKSLVLVGKTSIGRWDLASGRRLSTREVAVENPDGNKLSASLSRCGRFAALACNRGKMNCVTVFEVDAGRKVLSTIMDYGVAPPPVLCDGGKRLALPAPQLEGRHQLAVFDVATGRKRLDLATNYQKTPLAAGKDGALVAVVDDDCLVLLDPATGQAKRMTGLGEDALQLEFSRDGSALALTGYKGSRILNTATGKTLAHRKESSRMTAFSADGAHALSAGPGGQLTAWNPQTGEVELEAVGFMEPVSALAASADGRRLAAVSDSAECRVWDVATGDTLLSVRSPCSAGSKAAHVVISPDGSTVITSATRGGDPLAWNVDRRRLALVLIDGGLGAGPMAFSPNGRYAVACHHAGPESALRAWDVATGNSVLRDRFLATGVAFSRDGSEMFAADGDAKRVRRYDWLQKRPAEEFTLSNRPGGLSCSPDGRLIACGNCLLRAARGEIVARLEALEEAKAVCSFTPDGRRLLAVSEGKLHVFDTSDGRRLKIVSGPWKITAVVFSPDGKTLWAGLANGAVVGWGWTE